MLYLTLGRSEFQFIHLLHLIISAARQAWQIDINPKMNQPPKYQEMGYFLFACFLEKLSRNYCLQKTKISRSINDSFAGGSQTIFTNVNLIDKLHTELIDLSYKRLIFVIIWRFAIPWNRSLVLLVGLVIERTEVAYLKSFPCVVAKKTFQVTCGVASFQIQKMKLILFCRAPASPRRQKISLILQFAPQACLILNLMTLICFTPFLRLKLNS